MQEFIVTGQVPGTNITLTFDGVLSMVCVIVGIILLYSVYRHLVAQHASSIKQSGKKTTPNTATAVQAETVFQPTGAEASIN